MLPKLTRPSRWRTLLVGLAAVVAGLAGAAPVAAAPAVPVGAAEGRVLYAGHPQAVPGSYIVTFADGGASTQAVRSMSDTLAARYGVQVRFTYTAALRGLAVKASAEQARRLAADPLVDYVAQDQQVSVNAIPVQINPPSWGLDRVDQRSLPLDAKYHFPNTAPRITAYIIDTGIRYTHQEFGGRAVFGTDTVGGAIPPGSDCHGHGTHVAGTVGGRSVGLAKQVRLVAVRVLNCAGGGSFAQVIAGVDWVTNDALTSRGLGVANMSLGGGFFQPLNDAVTNSIAANVHYSVAAGNDFGADACTVSPASTPRATTVGATEINDNRAGFSNIGPCVDLFAPGVAINSAWGSADNAYMTLQGTSMASPHAAGTAAMWRQKFPADNASAVAGALTANATPGVVVNPGAGSPNLLLFMGMIPV
jgi:subtilisin family serine protease